MNSIAVLQELFTRVADDLPGVVDGLEAEQVNQQPGGTGNSIGWLLWHLARVEDAQVADIARALGLAGDEQVWLRAGSGAPWVERFGLPYPMEAHGYAMSTKDVAKFQLGEPGLLADYYAEVHQATTTLLGLLDEQQLQQVVDPNYEPPVTAGVRLVSIVNDVTQHLGQAAYLKGQLGH